MPYTTGAEKGTALGSRRKSREIAVQILYQFEMNRSDVDEGLKLFFEEHSHPEEIEKFARFLVQGVEARKSEIDRLIIASSENWSFERINPVDRGVLREAIFEFLFCEDIPLPIFLARVSKDNKLLLASSEWNIKKYCFTLIDRRCPYV